MTGGAVLLAYGGVEATGGTVLAGSKVATTAVKALGGACFTQGTLIWMKDGQRNIEEIREGDSVYAYDLESKKVVTKKVSATFVRETNQLIKLQFGREIIFTTVEHPFYVNGNWVEASKLKIGDRLFLHDKNKIPIEKITVLDTLVKVYNFTVEDEHNYFVGKNKVLVHNGCGSNLKLVTRSKDVLGHIFRNAAGHVNPSTIASQERYIKLFEKVANNMKNLNSNVLTNYQRGAGGFEGFSQTFRNGMQVWVQTTNGKIINAGVNIIPK